MEYEKMVSVAIITYQHVEFIEHTIKSVLMQETTYDYEIVIADDDSKDGTREIIKKYRDMYPDKIRLILQEHNVGALKNEISLLSACKGKYIANLDGDDYWTNPKKIQMQVDYLENHPECSACYGNADVIGDDIIDLFTGDLDDYKFFYDTTPVFATSAYMMRNYYLTTDAIKYYHGTKIVTDRITLSLALKYGKIGYIDEKMSIYRRLKHAGSFTSQSMVDQYADFLDSLNTQCEVVEDDVKPIIKEARLRVVKEVIIKKAIENKQYERLFEILFNNLSDEERVQIVTDKEVKALF